MSENEVYLKRQIEDLKRELDRLKTNVPETGGVWQDWTATPTGTGGSAGTFAQELNYAKYSVVGKICFIHYQARITNVGSWTGSVQINRPIARATSYFYNRVDGGGFIYAQAEAANGMKGILTNQETNYFRFTKNVGSAQIQWSDIAVNDWIGITSFYGID